MTKNILTIAACALSLAFQAQTTEKREIASFNKIQAEGAVQINYRTADATSLSVEADPAELKNVETTVKNGVLIVKTNGNFKRTVKLNITNKNLNSLTLNGACSFASKEEVKADNFEIGASGASKVEMPLSAKKVTTNAHGASDIVLTGNTESFSANLEGASNLKAYALKSATTTVNAKGASSANVFASQKLSVDCTGASNVKYKGDPKDVYKRNNEASHVESVN